MPRWWLPGLVFVLVVYLHNALPYLTMMPRVNVDEPWLLERAYQVLHTGIPSQPMLRLDHAYLLQVGYGYLYAPWIGLFGVGMWQARLLGVVLGFGIVAMAATVGRRLLTPAAGLMGALFLAADSNFLGGVRNARTDIPSVFFVAATLTAYVIGRERGRRVWFFASGAFAGLAMICHGNAFWVVAIILVWLLIDQRQRLLISPWGYWFAAGLLLTFGPYLGMVLVRWADVKVQIASFAGDRVPGWRPSFLMHQMALEVGRYHDWYFGLVTSVVPNPLLWGFKAATGIGVLLLVACVAGLWRRPLANSRGALFSVTLIFGSVLIFAAFINNKALVYLPHIVFGFSLAAGFTVEALAHLAGEWRRRRTPAAGFGYGTVVMVCLLGYGTATVAYYEKWYSTTLKSELRPYEETAATVRALVPSGPKSIFAAPQFWTAFAGDEGVDFFSYAAGKPEPNGERMVSPPVKVADKPVVLVIDEDQWKPELTDRSRDMSDAWQNAWLRYIRDRCSLYEFAPGTAYGTLASYRCWADRSRPLGEPAIVAGSRRYRMGPVVLRQDAADLARWSAYKDPRRTKPLSPTAIALDGNALRIAGDQWPGVVYSLPVRRGEHYLIQVEIDRPRLGDLLYLGRWDAPEVVTLAGGSSAGIPVSLVSQPWFPAARAFTATADAVRVLLYSEAPQTDFLVRSLLVRQLVPAEEPLSTARVDAR